MNHCFVFLSGFLLLNSMCPVVAAADSVRAIIEKDTAWIGEAVPLIITLYSPGPFSGTASFDLPDLAKTAIIRHGNPVVGSEDVDGESYLTQRHEFRIYTQQTDEILLPAFRVRFSGKQTFTSDAEPMEGMTPELRFQSDRPPGTERLGVVIAATQMEASQDWIPQNQTSFQAGDVIQRTVSRQAIDTTAMMLPPVLLDAPSGVRIYDTNPIVEDKTERGEARAIRADTIKYQFEQAGTFELPDIEFVHWNPNAEELKRDMLPGITVSVEAVAGDAETGASPAANNKSYWPLIASLLALAIVSWLFREPVTRAFANWRAQRNGVENLAARRVERACRTNDASSAYSAILEWQWVVQPRRTDAADPDTTQLEHECAVLSSILFSANAGETQWSGRQLLADFKTARYIVSRSRDRGSRESVLPTLNPT